ncbi:MAG TPA: carboxylesterase/lipase family protein [Acidimicrobiales bacterium]|nr:carboxylesterase/lipase family protein [Acidimicrobiales bacterium]
MDKVVAVRGGRVRGVSRQGLWSFSGIPYARSPEGDLRWRPPLEPEPWAEVRSAAEFGPIAPQPLPTGPLASPADPGANEPQSEDCLTLNIWTPEVPDAPRRVGGRPVMVWIHGGGFTGGSGSVFLYRGGRLSRSGDVVVVTLNYRLGALGFLGHRALGTGEGFVGNWGLHDQVAALRWVRQHIARFGGDPDNVTVFGESAGAFSIAALLGAPGATGLFRRAVIQSGGAHVHTVDDAERRAQRLADILGLPAVSRELLTAVPAPDLVAATTELAAQRPDPGLIPLPYLPVVDGSFLPQHPLAAVRTGASADVDLLIGSNRDELTLFGLGDPSLFEMDDDAVARWTALAAPDVPTAELLDAYRAARADRAESVAARDVWVALGSDCVFRWPSLQLAAARSSRSYVYLFDWESPAFGGMLGACHALELPFVFGVVDVPAVQLLSGSGPAADRLSSVMQQAWLSFARHGDPSHEELGPWPAWDAATRSTMVFGPSTGVVDAPRDTELAVWDQHRPLGTSAVR